MAPASVLLANVTLPLGKRRNKDPWISGSGSWRHSAQILRPRNMLGVGRRGVGLMEEGERNSECCFGCAHIRVKMRNMGKCLLPRLLQSKKVRLSYFFFFFGSWHYVSDLISK